MINTRKWEKLTEEEYEKEKKKYETVFTPNDYFHGKAIYYQCYKNTEVTPETQITGLIIAVYPHGMMFAAMVKDRKHFEHFQNELNSINLLQADPRLFRSAFSLIYGSNKELESLQNVQNFEKFFDFINSKESIDPDTRKEFREIVDNKFDVRDEEQKLADEISAFIEKEDYSGAIEKVIKLQGEGHYEYIWELAEQFLQSGQNHISKNQLINLYESIHSSNPHYVEAQERLIPLYENDKNDPVKCLTKKLTAATNANDRKLEARFFTELAGFPFSSEPKDPHDMLEIAKLLRELNAENMRLKKENEKLKEAALSKESKRDIKESPLEQNNVFGSGPIKRKP